MAIAAVRGMATAVATSVSRCSRPIRRGLCAKRLDRLARVAEGVTLASAFLIDLEARGLYA
jgi:hypothetical protein